MRSKTRIPLAALAFAVSSVAGSSFAHHSFSGVFDAGRVVHVQGQMTRFDRVNPHSLMYVNAMGENGDVEHWVLEGPSGFQLTRMGVENTAFKAGDTVAACGYATKDGVNAVKSDPTSGVSWRLMSAELLTLPSGQKLVWSNYGQRKCLDLP